MHLDKDLGRRPVVGHRSISKLGIDQRQNRALVLESQPGWWAAIFQESQMWLTGRCLGDHVERVASRVGPAQPLQDGPSPPSDSSDGAHEQGSTRSLQVADRSCHRSWASATSSRGEQACNRYSGTDATSQRRQDESPQPHALHRHISRTSADPQQASSVRTTDGHDLLQSPPSELLEVVPDASMRDSDERDFSALCPFLDRSRRNAEQIASSGLVDESNVGWLVAWRHALSSPRS